MAIRTKITPGGGFWFAALLRTARDAVVLIDDRDRVKALNTAAEKMLGVRSIEVLHRPALEALKLEPGEMPALTGGEAIAWSSLTEALAGRTLHGQVAGQLSPAEGPILDVVIDLAPVIDLRGNHVGWVATILPNQAAAGSRAALERTGEVAELVSATANLLNNSLQTILGHAELLTSEHSTQASRKNWAETVRRTSQHSAELVRTMLAAVDKRRTKLVAEVPALKPRPGPLFAQPVLVKAASPPPVAAKRVLIVDDSEEVAELISLGLEQLKLAFEALSDPLEALRRVEDPGQRFDLVIMDLMMPGMTGQELAVRMRSLQPQLPVLFVSGSLDDAEAARLEAMPRTSFLAKPFRFDQLSRAIDTLLGPAATRSLAG